MVFEINKMRKKHNRMRCEGLNCNSHNQPSRKFRVTYRDMESVFCRECILNNQDSWSQFGGIQWSEIPERYHNRTKLTALMEDDLPDYHR